MKLLFRGGDVVSGDSVRTLDVLVDGEKVVWTGTGLDHEDAREINVQGKLLFPGFIDAHTHFDLEVAGTRTSDDFESGTRAALLGGTTAIIDFAAQSRAQSLAEAYAAWMQKAAGKSYCDYGFHMSITGWRAPVKDELKDMMDLGVTSFKLYMTYSAMKMTDAEILDALAAIREAGGIAGVHCENDTMIQTLVWQYKSLHQNGVRSHPRTRPPEAEAEAVSRLLAMAGKAGTPVIIVHLSTWKGLRAVDEARSRGQEVFVETCPQYLLLDDHLYDLPGFEGAKYVIAPPLRKPDDQASLWQALADGRIQTLCTDHCSFTTRQKELGKDDFSKIPGGMPGVETRAVLAYSRGVAGNRISLPRMCQVLSENPARLYGLYPSKGLIAPGSDADIVIFDPSATWTIHAGDLAQKCDYTPYENMTVQGRVEQVYLRGMLAADRHQAVAGPAGRYLQRKHFSSL